MLAALLLPASAYADTPENSSAEAATTVKVGYYQSRNFQEGAEEGQIKTGYGYEYLQRVASYAGWDCEYEYGTWKELYQKLCAGEIDVMAGVSRAGHNSSEVLFPSASMLNETFYIYKGVNDASIESGNVATLSGKSVGVVSGSSSEVHFDEWLAGNSCGALKKSFSSFDQCKAAYQQGQIDAFVSADNLVYSLSGVQPIEIVGKEPYYLAISKNRPDLLAQANVALPVMNSLDRGFLSELQSRYAADTSVNAFVTPEERSWTQSHLTLTIGYLNNYLPYSATDSDGNPTGLLVDEVAEMLDKLPCDWEPGITYRSFDSQSDLVDALESGEVDLAFPVGGGTWFAEQAGYLRSSPVISPSMDLVVKEPYDSETFASSVAVNRNNLMQRNYAIAHFPDADIIEYNSIEECFAAVKRGDASGTVVNGLRATALLSSEPGLYSVQLPDSDDRCFGVSKGNGPLLELVNRAIAISGVDFGTDASYKYTAGLFKYTWQDFVTDNWATLLVCLLATIVVIVVLAVRRYRTLEATAAHDAQMNKQLEEALRKAEQASHAKDMLLRNLSHDIRTPLNGILGAMGTSIGAANVEEAKASLVRAKDASDHLVSLVDDLLEISTLRSGKVEVAEEDFNLCEVVEEAVSEKRPFAETADVAISVGSLPPKSSSFVRGSRGYLHKILVNVIDNAVRYNKAGGSVSLEASFEPGEQEGRSLFTCTVSDTGIGMSEEDKNRIFEPFFQADEGARSEYPGSGLGMPIVYELLKIIGGEVEVSSVLGAGTIVKVSVPFQRTQPPSSPSDAAHAQQGIAGMRVLLVEDNPLNLEVAQCMLEQAGAEVVAARDGKEALELFSQSEEGCYDAILMDLMMPAMNGIEATRAIRALSRKDCMVPILATTAKVTEEDRKAAFAAGMNEHIAKPLDAQRLVAALSKYRK